MSNVVAFPERDSDERLVAEAIAARKRAEATEADASPSRWEEADNYAALSERGWTQQRIAGACETTQASVSRFIAAARNYAVPHKRPSFWNAYAEVTGEKSTAERIVASAENEWYTPAKYIAATRDVLGAIDLDPASSVEANRTVGAASFFTAEDDGLSHHWSGRVWLNPPYGRLAGDFTRKLLAHHDAMDVRAAVLLVNAHCTDTDWFQPLWDYALCFTDHRIDFDSAGREKETSSTHGSVFVYLGRERARFVENFDCFGAVVVRL